MASSGSCPELKFQPFTKALKFVIIDLLKFICIKMIS